MRRILVSGASGIVGYGILRSLRQSGEPCLLVGASVYEDSAAPAFCDVFEKLPLTNAPDYLEALLSVLKRHSIDMLMPGIEIDMYHWNDHRAEIEAAGAMPLLNRPDLIHLCKDKWRFYEALKAAGSFYAIESSLENDFHALEERFGLPFLLKPRTGFGSKGIVRVASEETFASCRGDMDKILMAQPIIGNDEEEYTTSAFCDGEGGYFAGMTLRRKLSRDGFTDRAEVVDMAEFAPAIEVLCQKFRPIGPTNFQFRRGPDGLKLLEINPRISSSTSIRTAFGYNESAMAVQFFLEKRVPVQPAVRRGRAVRYTDEKIFYDDRVHL